MSFDDFADTTGDAIEVAGVTVIVVGILVASYMYGRDVRRRTDDSYTAMRRRVGRAILLGLEFLVAGDIVGTVVVDPTFESVGVLAVIVAIRTFLSFALELEITGALPWRRTAAGGAT